MSKVCEVKNKMEIKTAHGMLIVYEAANPDYPGVYIDFKPAGRDDLISIPIAMVEDAPTKSKSPETPDDAVVVRVWDDPWREDYVSRSDIQVSEIIKALESEA